MSTTTLPTSSRTTTRRTGDKAWAADYIKARRRFTAASMTGDDTPWHDTGRMPHEWAARFNTEMRKARDSSSLVYVVLSYGTPIAWEANGVRYVPSVRYSNTTSRHQTAARIGFGDYVEALS